MIIRNVSSVEYPVLKTRFMILFEENLLKDSKSRWEPTACHVPGNLRKSNTIYLMVNKTISHDN